MNTRFGSAAVTVAFSCALGATAAQSPPGATMAQAITGTWTLNRELSPDISNVGGGREGRRGGGLLFAIAAAPQRGRGGGGGGRAGADASSPVPSEEVAAQAALTVISQVPLEIRIVATETEVKFIEPRGESVFRLDGKTTSIAVPGGTIKVKSRWDRSSLRQEFFSAQRLFRRSWTVEPNGRLVVKQRIESVAFSTKEIQAVFDRAVR